MATIDQSSIFATGTDGETQPDSITIGKNALWAEYGNGVSSTGGGGSSTIVEYSLSGKVEKTISIAGSVDGLKIDPTTGMVFALQNQDGNSTLSLIDPATGKVSGPLSYSVTSATRGYDDVAFLNGAVYMSYTNPTGSGDPVLQQLTNGNQPMGTLVTTDILKDGATGTNIATGQTNQPIPLSDPDSLKTTPNGDLMLTSGADNTLTLITDPGTAAQSERFVQLTNLPASSSLDDVIVPTSSTGTFYLSNAGTNQIEAFKVSGLNTSDAYASVGTEIVQVDLQTGAETPIITGLSGSHGMSFVPTANNAPTVQQTSIFATGAEVGGATQPDSVTMGDGSIWVEYGNGADSTGKLANGGSSTVVRYDMQGRVLATVSLPGEIDGLKFDPVSNQVFALKNQDANSHLYLIDPATNKASGPLSYGSGYVYGANSSRGYDDVAFANGKVFMSYTNPTTTGDSVVQMLDNGNDPSGTLTTTSILRLGDTGTNLTTGQVNQPLPLDDPDSLKTLSDGSLILTSDHDASLTIISHPGTAQQTASFVTLPAGSSGLDDAIIPTATSGTFVIANGGANDVLKVNVTGLNTNDIYVAVGSDNAIDQLDPKTGALTPVITGLNSPHGMSFVPSTGAAATPVAQAGSAMGQLSATDFPVPGAHTGSQPTGAGAMTDQTLPGTMMLGSLLHHSTSSSAVAVPAHA
jgi:hypothetical protein